MSFNIIAKFQDKKLKEKLKNKDQEAFEELYDKNADDIYRFIFFKVGSKDEAMDLTSLSFLKTWEHIQKRSLSNKETLRALLYKISRNVIIDYYRTNKKNISLEDQKNKADILDEQQNVFLEASVQSDYQELYLKILKLKNEYREVIIMKYLNELSLDEISQITGKKKMNIRVLLHRAIKALKDIITEEK